MVKKLLLLLLAVLTGAGGVKASQTVGNTNNVTTWWTAFSDTYTISPQGSLTFTFTNYSDQLENYHNWVLGITSEAARNDNANGYVEYMILRADNYQWGNAGNTVSSNYDWTTFREDMDGSKVTMNIVRNGSTVEVTATMVTTGGTTYTETATTTADANKNINVFLTTEGGHLTDVCAITNSDVKASGSSQFFSQNRMSDDGAGNFTAAGNAGNQYALALGDLSHVEDLSIASMVTIEFDTKINSGSRMLIGIGDKSVRGINANGSNKSSYNTEGLAMRFGTSDGTYFRVNDGTNNGNAFGVDAHVTFTLDRTNHTYSYSIKNKADNSTLFSANNVVTTVDKVNLIEGYSWQSNAQVYLNNLTYSYTFNNTFDDPTFSATYLQTELIALEFDEPTLNYTAGADVTYSSSNTKIAVFDSETQKTGNVRFINSGRVDITASVKYGSNTKTAKYTVTVQADEAQYNVEGNKFIFTGSGKLTQSIVTMVPKITLEIGNQEAHSGAYYTNYRNVAIVRSESREGSNQFVATKLAGTGWRDAYFEDPSNPQKPTQGTFYKFVPTSSGKLNVTGFITTSNDPSMTTSGSAVLVDATNNYEVKAEVTAVNTHSANITGITLEKDHEYYLYGTNPNQNSELTIWSTYELHAFEFIPDFRYENKSVVLAQGENSGGQLLTGGTNPTFTMDLKGDITATLNADGTVSGITGDGGAIIVKATEGTDEAYYVITVPYATKKWMFYTTDDGFNNTPTDFIDLGYNAERDWAITYKVRLYDNVTRNLYYLNVPVLSNNEPVDGDNAAYYGATAGLVIEGPAKTYGGNAHTKYDLKKLADYNDFYGTSYTQEEFDNLKATDPEFVDQMLKDMLSIPTSDVYPENTHFIDIAKGAKLTIPGLKKGQYVRFKWSRYSDTNGHQLRLTNLMDLDNVMDLTGVTISAGAPQDNHRRGFEEFVVKEDGDVSVEVIDNGWLNIYSIQVGEVGEFIDTDMRLVIGNNTAARLFNRNQGETLQVQFANQPNQFYQVAAGSVKFSLEDISDGLMVSGVKHRAQGNGTPAISIDENTGLMTVTSGHGTVTVVQKLVQSSGAVVDYEKTPIKIVEKGNTEQSYPYTWDFTNISDETKTKLSSDSDHWTSNDGGNSYTANEGGQSKYVQNTELENGDGDDVAEYDGLGFLTSVDDNAESTGISNVSITTNGTGLVVGNAETTTVVVPDVPEGATVFVRVVENENSEITLKSGNTTIEEATTTGVDENSNVYTIEGNGSDVNIELKDVTVEGIAVTNLWKECSFWDETEEHEDGAEETGYYCYNSDSHDKPIKYSLTQYYTNVFMKALTVKSTNSEDNTVEVDDIDYTPAYTGVIVYSIDKGIDHPLFVPAVNDQKSKAEDEAIKAASMMIPHVESGEVAASDGDSIRYVFTNVYNKVSDVGTKISANTPGFYQVNRAGVLKANRAYLVLPKETSAGVKAMKLYTLSYTGNEEEDPTAINGVDAAFDLNGEFYTISGVKLQGVPTQKGIYIQNGKKVMIK